MVEVAKQEGRVPGQNEHFLTGAQMGWVDSQHLLSGSFKLYR